MQIIFISMLQFNSIGDSWNESYWDAKHPPIPLEVG